MSHIETFIPEDAINAWEVADFSLLPDDEQTLVSVIDGPHGREGLLPTSLFLPTAYDLDRPRIAEHRVRTAWGDAHVEGVLERNLGTHGARVGSHILGELMLLAGYSHQASMAYSAARIMVSSEVASPETFVSVWDDGRPYESAAAVEEAFSKDRYGSLFGTAEHRSLLDEDSPFTTSIVKTAAGLFGGSVAIFSGTTRTVIRSHEDGYTFTHDTTDGIEGNLVVARMPHTVSSVFGSS